MFQRQRATANPWELLGIEWQVPTPVPVFNFETVPTNWSLPYDYDTGNPAAQIITVAPSLGGAQA